jgi:hypothetical protein
MPRFAAKERTQASLHLQEQSLSTCPLEALVMRLWIRDCGQAGEQLQQRLYYPRYHSDLFDPKEDQHRPTYIQKLHGNE